MIMVNIAKMMTRLYRNNKVVASMRAMVHSLRSLSIKIQLVLLAVATVVVVVFVVLFSYYDTINELEVNNKENVAQLVLQNQISVENYFDQITEIAYNVAYNPSVQGLLSETNMSKLIEYNKMTNGYLNNIKDMNSEIIDIIVLNNENESNLNHLLGRTVEQITEQMYDSDNGRIYFSEVEPYKRGLVYSDSIKATICTYYSSQNPLNNNDISLGTKIGWVVVVFKVNNLNIISGSSIGNLFSSLLLIDRNNNFFSNRATTDDEKAARLFLEHENVQFDQPRSIPLNGQKYLIQGSQVPIFGGKIISVLNETKSAASINKARSKALIILLVAFLVLGIPFGLVIGNILSPLNRLMRFMASVKSGSLKNLKKRLELAGYAEIELMAAEFNNMLEQLDNLTNTLVETNAKLYEVELNRKESELALLQSQINPHFLYNTLESIKGIALVKDDDEIFEMTQALGRILRYSLKEAEMVTISEECSIIKSYIRIQQIRFGNRFDINYDFEDEILDQRVPKMILQPFVENAIYHGLEPKVSCGLLSISGRMHDDDCIQIIIQDNGSGMSESQMKNVQNDLGDSLQIQNHNLYDRKNGIGIKNVNSRLKLIYGDQYGIHIESALNEGTKAIIKIPSWRD